MVARRNSLRGLLSAFVSSLINTNSNTAGFTLIKYIFASFEMSIWHPSPPTFNDSQGEGLFRLCLVFSLLLLDQIIITWCLRVCFIIILVFSGTFQRQISPNGSFLPANYSHPVRSRPTIYSQEPPPIIVIITLEIDRHRLLSSRALSCLDTHYNSSLS